MTLAQKLILLLTFSAGFIVRTYHLNYPLADWHSHRQADTASVTRNFITSGLDLLHPIYHDLSNIQSGQDNPHGYRMVEFPIYNAITASISQFSHQEPEIIGRLVNVVFYLIAGFFLFSTVKNLTHLFWPSFSVLFIFLFLPFGIYYSRTILPEPTAILFTVLTIYLFPKNIYLSAVTFALGILIKPYVGLLLFPVLLFYSFQNLQKNIKNIFSLAVFALISLVPFVLWRQWISHFPAGIPASNWLFNEGGMRFRPAWFRWLFYERIGKLILGVYGTIPLILGFAYKKKRIQIISLASLIGVILYFSVIARGNIQHDYYQVLTLPFISLVSGLGLYYLSQYVFSSKFLGITSALIVIIFSLAFSGYQIKDYYQINNPIIVTAGQTVNQLVPKNALVIAPYNGDTAFLYQTHRSGYPIEIYDLPKLKTQITQPLYYVSTSYNDYTNDLAKKFPSLYRDNRFIILDLNHEIN